MEKETSKQFRLGIFVVSGTLLLIAALYFIGRNQDLFGRTIHVSTFFTNVNGLQPGNNVRFAGADAGSVESVEVIGDTIIRVEIILKEEYGSFIREDAIASIGTDGLMGSKLINIVNQTNSKANMVKDGSTILTQKPVETDEMLRTLNRTNEYVSDLAFNLKVITDKIGNSRGTLWKLLTDTTLSEHLDSTFIYFKQAGNNISGLSNELNRMVEDVNKGKGLLGVLTKDTVIADRLYHIVGSLNTAGEQAAQVSDELLKLVKDIDQGKGTFGVLLRDSNVANDLRTAVVNLKQSSESLNQSLEAIQQVPLIKKYLKETEKNKNKKKQ